MTYDNLIIDHNNILETVSVGQEYWLTNGQKIVTVYLWQITEDSVIVTRGNNVYRLSDQQFLSALLDTMPA